MNQAALQYGGDGSVGLVTLQKFWAFNAQLVESALKIQYATDSGKVISRTSPKKEEEPEHDLTIKAAAKHFGVNTADPSVDSPRIEVRASYTTNAPASFVAKQVNVGELAEGFATATNAEALTAWLVTFFKDANGHAMPKADAAAYAARVFPS